MGSWNGTCAVSNLHIQAGQEVAVFMLTKNHKEKHLSYNDVLYSFCPLPFYGKNDSYGGVEDCYGIGLDIMLSAIREKLFEMNVGANEYHDIPVKKKDFDIEKLFEADHEGRLGITTPADYFRYETRCLEHYAQLEGKMTKENKVHKAALEETLKKGVNPFQRVTHIQVHRQIFDDILEKHTIQIDYNKNLSFKKVAASVPALVDNLMTNEEPLLMFFDSEGSLAAQFLLSRNYSHKEELIIKVGDLVKNCVEQGMKKEQLCELITDLLKGVWLDNFMTMTRKLWVPPCGVGSQSQEMKPYQILANSTKKILSAQRREEREMEEMMYGQ